jgi:hypothetical protein
MHNAALVSINGELLGTLDLLGNAAQRGPDNILSRKSQTHQLALRTHSSSFFGNDNLHTAILRRRERHPVTH